MVGKWEWTIKFFHIFIEVGSFENEMLEGNSDAGTVCPYLLHRGLSRMRNSTTWREIHFFLKGNRC